MSILDDAIREHLELKRAHGADESELKRLEDEAFGPPQRPDQVDPLAEAPTEFLTAPSEVVEQAEAEAEGRRVPNITDLQEAPERQEAEASTGAAEQPAPPPEPAIEEQPAGEHEVISDPPSEPPAPEAQAEEMPDGVHTTEEREAIADQPTEMFDVQAEIDANAGGEAESPSDEQLLDASASEEPRLTPPEPQAQEDDDDEFFSEQRLSDELNQALEAPVTEEEPLPQLPEEPAPDPDPEPSEPDPPSEPPSPGAHVEEPTAIYDVEGTGEGDFEEPEGESSPDSNVYEPETGSHDDVLEDTPEFLEDTPEDDDLWFEQRPPKDFDFDD